MNLYRDVYLQNKNIRFLIAFLSKGFSACCKNPVDCEFCRSLSWMSISLFEMFQKGMITCFLVMFVIYDEIIFLPLKLFSMLILKEFYSLKKSYFGRIFGLIAF